MVEAALAHELATAVRETPVPEDASTAERSLASLLSTRLPVLEQAPFTERARTALRRVLREAEQKHERPQEQSQETDESARDESKPVAGDLARAVLHLVADRPGLFRGRPGYVLGVPVDSMTGILEEAQRYLAWLGAQGPIGTVHPWAAVVAGDLAQRIRWRALGPGRGAGRLLWMCERMATAPLAPDLVPRMWRAARARGVDAPDWSGTTPPNDCALPPDRYRALLAERATGVHLDPREGGFRVTAPPGSVIRLWNGATTTCTAATARRPPCSCRPMTRRTTRPAAEGGAVFTRGGDRLGTGWLGAYAAIRR